MLCFVCLFAADRVVVACRRLGVDLMLYVSFMSLMFCPSNICVCKDRIVAILIACCACGVRVFSCCSVSQFCVCVVCVVLRCFCLVLVLNYLVSRKCLWSTKADKITSWGAHTMPPLLCMWESVL